MGGHGASGSADLVVSLGDEARVLVQPSESKDDEDLDHVGNERKDREDPGRVLHGASLSVGPVSDQHALGCEPLDDARGSTSDVPLAPHSSEDGHGDQDGGEHVVRGKVNNGGAGDHVDGKGGQIVDQRADDDHEDVLSEAVGVARASKVVISVVTLPEVGIVSNLGHTFVLFGTMAPEDQEESSTNKGTSQLSNNTSNGRPRVAALLDREVIREPVEQESRGGLKVRAVHEEVGEGTSDEGADGKGNRAKGSVDVECAQGHSSDDQHWQEGEDEGSEELGQTTGKGGHALHTVKVLGAHLLVGRVAREAIAPQVQTTAEVAETIGIRDHSVLTVLLVQAKPLRILIGAQKSILLDQTAVLDHGGALVHWGIRHHVLSLDRACGTLGHLRAHTSSSVFHRQKYICVMSMSSGHGYLFH